MARLKKLQELLNEAKLSASKVQQIYKKLKSDTDKKLQNFDFAIVADSKSTVVYLITDELSNLINYDEEIPVVKELVKKYFKQEIYITDKNDWKKDNRYGYYFKVIEGNK